VGEAAKGGELLAIQIQEWMGIRTMSKKAGYWLQVSKIGGNKGQRVELERISSDV
jgi:hypothetical protein